MTMRGFFGASARILALSLVVGFAALVLLPSVDGPVIAGISIPDPSANSCKKQHWPNVDRRCLWREPNRHQATSSRPPAKPAEAVAANAKEIETKPAAPEPAIASVAHDGAPAVVSSVVEPPVAGMPASLSALASIAVAPVSEGVRAARSPSRRSEAARAANAGDIAVTVVNAAGSRRTIVIRPTSPQDVLYYSQRAVAAAHGAARL